MTSKKIVSRQHCLIILEAIFHFFSCLNHFCNQKKKYTSITWLLFFLFFSMDSYSNSNNDSGGKQGFKITSVNLVEVAYAYAIIDIEIFVSETENIKKYLSADIFAPSIASGSLSLHDLKYGFNKIRLQINRSRFSAIEIETETHDITMRVNLRGAGNFSIKGKKLFIKWPGSEYVHKLLDNYPGHANGFNSVREIVISSALPERHEIYKALLKGGVPIEKIRFKNFSRASYGIGSRGIMQMSEVRKIISAAITNSKEQFNFISMPMMIDNSIVIGENDPRQKQIPNGLYNQLLTTSMSDAEFLNTIAIKFKTPEEEVDSIYREARSLIDSGKDNSLKKAKILLDELVAVAPDFPQAYLELARFYMKRNPGEIEDPNSTTLIRAERNILIAKNLDPDMADVYVLLGYVFTNQLRYKEAEAAYNRAEKIGTNNLWLYANRALNFEKQDMIEEAAVEYKKVIRAPLSTGPGSNRYHPKDLSYRRMFQIYSTNKQFKEIDDLYQRYSLDFPWEPCTFLWRAEIKLIHLNDAQGAIDNYLAAKSKGCRKDTSIISVAYFKKWANLKEKNADQMVIQQTLRQAQGTAPSDAELFFTLASSAHTAELIPAIVQEGYSIDLPDKSTQTALMKSLQQADLVIIERLLSNGANPNFLPHENIPPPLAIAVYLKNKALVELLLKYGADPSEKVPGGISIMKWAEMNDYKEFLPILKERAGSSI
ncbi:hypothetical protein KDX31_03245 [Amphritea atlantica]|uniref:Ankyrin repeat-containing protein n=1 Tax=Amphritea atlantica TaxID=355243 RepID=A0ABY5GVN2_9GAMM|nr:hypothetical protein KDX31_03245 [Amphritea atlantica]